MSPQRLLLVVLWEMCIWLLRTPSLVAVLCVFPVKQPSLTWCLTRFKMEEATWDLITIVNTYPTVPFFPNFPFFYCMVRRGDNTQDNVRGGEFMLLWECRTILLLLSPLWLFPKLLSFSPWRFPLWALGPLLPSSISLDSLCFFQQLQLQSSRTDTTTNEELWMQQRRLHRLKDTRGRVWENRWFWGPELIIKPCWSSSK